MLIRPASSQAASNNVIETNSSKAEIVIAIELLCDLEIKENRFRRKNFIRRISTPKSVYVTKKIARVIFERELNEL